MPWSIHFVVFPDDFSAPVAALAIRRAVGLAKAEAKRQHGRTPGHAFTSLPTSLFELPPSLFELWRTGRRTDRKRGYFFGCGRRPRCEKCGLSHDDAVARSHRRQEAVRLVSRACLPRYPPRWASRGSYEVFLVSTEASRRARNAQAGVAGEIRRQEPQSTTETREKIRDVHGWRKPSPANP